MSSRCSAGKCASKAAISRATVAVRSKDESPKCVASDPLCSSWRMRPGFSSKTEEKKLCGGNTSEQLWQLKLWRVAAICSTLMGSRRRPGLADTLSRCRAGNLPSCSASASKPSTTRPAPDKFTYSKPTKQVPAHDISISNHTKESDKTMPAQRIPERADKIATTPPQPTPELAVRSSCFSAGNLHSCSISAGTCCSCRRLLPTRATSTVSAD